VRWIAAHRPLSLSSTVRRVLSRVLLLAAVIASWAAPLGAQQVPQTLPPNTVMCRLGISAGPVQACPFATLGAALSPYTFTSTGFGVDQNVLNNQNSNYTIASTDCGKTIYFPGASGQLTLTLPSVSGFATTCSVLVKNGDSGNGKILSGFPSDLGSVLYPLQSVGVKIVNGAWKSFYAPGPYVVGPGGVTLYASTSGSDSNDCLSAATVCTLKGVCISRRNFDTSFSGGFNIMVADGTYIALDGFDALCSIIGNAGGSSPALTNLIGNCSTPGNVVLLVPSNATGVFTKDAGEVEISCLEIDGAASSTNNIGVQGAQFSIVDILGVTFGGTWGTNSRHYDFSQSASLNLDAGETIAGNFFQHWKLASGANLSATSATTCTVTPTFTTLLSLKGATADLTGWSSSGCSGATGTKAVLRAGYAVFNSTPCNTLLFGSINCQITPGFPDDAADAPTSPTGIAQLTIGTLPTCNSSTQGQLSYVTNGVASPTYRASVSTTGSTLQLVGCDGSGWTYH
jgi:hypothetical protein